MVLYVYEIYPDFYLVAERGSVHLPNHAPLRNTSLAPNSLITLGTVPTMWTSGLAADGRVLRAVTPKAEILTAPRAQLSAPKCWARLCGFVCWEGGRAACAKMGQCQRLACVCIVHEIEI